MKTVRDDIAKQVMSGIGEGDPEFDREFKEWGGMGRLSRRIDMALWTMAGVGFAAGALLVWLVTRGLQ